MNTSHQAAGGRHLAPAVPPYIWRALIWQCEGDDWKLLYVYEMSDRERLEIDALDTVTEQWEPGVTAMHYVIGEVGNA